MRETLFWNPAQAREFRLQINKFDFNSPTSFAQECSYYQLLLRCALKTAMLPVSPFLAGRVQTRSLRSLAVAWVQYFPPNCMAFFLKSELETTLIVQLHYWLLTSLKHVAKRFTKLWEGW